MTRPLFAPLFALFLALLATAIAASTAHAAPTIRNETGGIAQDIASAGRLRLQSQRLAKLYLQIGLGLNVAAAQKQLRQGATQFDSELSALAPYAGTLKTQRTLMRTRDLWTELKGTLATSFSAESMKRVNYLADDLMIVTGKLSMQIEAEAETPIGRLLDLSLRQSMLAQRLARLYLMAQAGDKSRGRLVDVEQASKEFTAALNELSSARENSPASREALELTRTQWLFFENEIRELGRGDGGKPLHVATASERIMEVLDAVSMQYAQDYSASLSAPPARLAGAGGSTRRN